MSSNEASTEKTKNYSFDDYEGSEFEFETDKSGKQKKLVSKLVPDAPTTSRSCSLPSKSHLKEEQSKAEGQVRSYHFRSMNAYAKHIKLVNDYLQYYSGGKTLKEVFQRDTSKDKTDLDVIREEIKFVWDESDEPSTWEQRLAKRYYDKLYKEYCICDLTLYKQNKIAMRWRVEKEVFTGKGQFICGDKKCSERESLKTWEVNFGYIEHGEKKNALVKLRLCPECSIKLNYHHKKKEYVKPVKQKKSKHKNKESKETKSESDTDSDREETSKKKLKTDNKEEKQQELVSSTDGNMIIMNADDSMWKQAENLAQDESKAREEDFEDYLEDLFL